MQEQEKKTKYRGYTQAQNKATQKYIKANYDDIRLRVKKGEKERYQNDARGAEKSLNQYIIDLLDANSEAITIKPLEVIAQKIKEHAKQAGQTVEDYILDAVNGRINYEEAGERELDPWIIPNLINWMKEHGHTAEEVADCIQSLPKKDR